jgi:hypothetical protein
MAQLEDLSPEQQAELNEWAESCPPVIQELLTRVKPNRLYLNKPTQQRGYAVAWNENGTVTLAFIGKYNGPDVLDFDRNVFGLTPEELEECDLPSPDEQLGARLTDPKDILSHINDLRAKNGLPPLADLTTQGD